MKTVYWNKITRLAKKQGLKAKGWEFNSNIAIYIYDPEKEKGWIAVIFWENNSLHFYEYAEYLEKSNTPEIREKLFNLAEAVQKDCEEIEMIYHMTVDRPEE